jgi:hypothetical protein
MLLGHDICAVRLRIFCVLTYFSVSFAYVLYTFPHYVRKFPLLNTLPTCACFGYHAAVKRNVGGRQEHEGRFHMTPFLLTILISLPSIA